MPRRNKTPKHTPYTNTRTSCTTKRRFAARHDAEQAAELRMLENPAVNLGVYQCDQCQGWHLTSTKPRMSSE